MQNKCNPIKETCHDYLYQIQYYCIDPEPKSINFFSQIFSALCLFASISGFFIVRMGLEKLKKVKEFGLKLQDEYST